MGKKPSSASGIDITIFKTHSTRSAATSKALDLGIPINEILEAACWSNAKTFQKIYNRPIVPNTFGENILQGLYKNSGPNQK